MSIIHFTYLLLILMVTEESLLIDFDEHNPFDWEVVNDGVMGGLSQGKAWIENGNAVFKGEVSLENNGGFSTLRTLRNNIDLSNFTKVKVRYKASGQKFAISLQPFERWYQARYKIELGHDNDQWHEETFVLREFKESRISQKSENTIPADLLKDIKRISFINSGKKAGSFRLEIDYLLFE